LEKKSTIGAKVFTDKSTSAEGTEFDRAPSSGEGKSLKESIDGKEDGLLALCTKSSAISGEISSFI
jgi:hypothetical protein